MTIIKCKMCGGDIELTTDKTFGTCEFCGSTVTLPRIDDEQRAAAFNRGNHFRRIGEFDKALAVYERIIREDDTDAEAHWCAALCRFGIEYVEDPATYEWIPTCHRASFDSFLEDVDLKAAVEHSDGLTRRLYQKEAAKIAEIQRGILATSQNTEPYDVFICYKESDEDGQRTRDSLMAQDIYYQLTEQGHRVFFSRITLEDVPGAQYEPYIFAALNSAKVMVAVGTKPEHFSAVWVKNEWSRFLALMRRDHSRVLLPCYRGMDPYDLPEQLAVLQSYDMGKIGFIQDLIRGIGKVLDTANTASVQKPLVEQQGGSGNIAALLKRGNMALEDGEWQKADHFFEEVLNQDAECALAYYGGFLAKKKATSITSYMEQELTLMIENVHQNMLTCQEEDQLLQQWIGQSREKYMKTGVLTQEQILSLCSSCTTYASTLAYWKAHRDYMENYFTINKKLQRALQFANPELRDLLLNEHSAFLARIDSFIYNAEKSDAQTEADIIQKAKEAIDWRNGILVEMAEKAMVEKEAEYQRLCKKQETTDDEWGLQSLKNGFWDLGSYKDSQNRAEWCRKKALEQAKARAEKLTQLEKASAKTSAWKAQGLCAHCGGAFTGLFSKKCSHCGKPKNY